MEYNDKINNFAKQLADAVINNGNVPQALDRLSYLRSLPDAYNAIFIAQQQIFNSIQTLLQGALNDRLNTTR
jgi:hypothetical protein